MSDEQIENEGWRPRFRPACSSMSLCNVCHEIVLLPHFIYFEDDTIYEHHLSQVDLLEAAEKRCYICRLLQDKMSKPDFRFPSSKQSEPARSLRFWCKRPHGSMEQLLKIFYGYVEGSLTELLTLTFKVGYDVSQLATDFPEQSTWSAANIEQAKQWLQGDAADNIVPDSIAFLPKRLLHVQAFKDDSYKVKLCEGSTIAPGAQYLTLSHCWGNIDFMRLKESNIKEFQKSIDYQSLSQTFRDAIKVTCDLGFQYLWIDSLCIIQNQDSLEDWLSQGPTMGEIYKNAKCNISADVAQDGDTGFIRDRDIETLLPLRVPSYFLENSADKWTLKEYYLLFNESWGNGVGSSPLGNRAWVLQERLLSTKIIHFTAHQLFFESKDSRHEANNCSEQWPRGIPSNTGDGPVIDKIVYSWNQLTGKWLWTGFVSDPDDRWWYWIYLVEIYSRMRLTYDTDRLAALSGAVKEIQRHSDSGDEYMAGLWKHNLVRQLLWYNTYPQSCLRTHSYTAPTWSWASTASGVSHCFGLGTPDRCQQHVKFVEAQISSKLGKENTGAIKDGLLRLRGLLRQAWLNQGNHKTDQKSFWTIGGSRKSMYFLPDDTCTGKPIETMIGGECRKRLYEALPRIYAKERILSPRATITIHAPTQSVFLLPMFSYLNDDQKESTFVTIGLALIPTGKVRGQFQRVGLFITTHKSGLGSILHLPSRVEGCYYEKKKRGRYTISIV